jgi:hypothetical protein
MAEQGESRRPLVVLAVVGALAVLVFVLGVGAGAGGDDGGSGGWPDRLRDLVDGEDLTTADLVLTGGSCSVDGQVITFAGSCTFEVPASGGRLSLGAPTRRATLAVGGAPVGVAIVIEDQEIAVEMDAGEQQDLTFGRSGGRLALGCLGLSGCAVALVPAG